MLCEAHVVYEPLVAHGFESISAPTWNDYREGIGYFLEPLFRDDPHRSIGGNRLRALPDGDRAISGAHRQAVEDCLCRDEVKQRYAWVGDDGNGRILLVFCWHIGLVSLR